MVSGAAMKAAMKADPSRQRDALSQAASIIGLSGTYPIGITRTSPVGSVTLTTFAGSKSIIVQKVDHRRMRTSWVSCFCMAMAKVMKTAAANTIAQISRGILTPANHIQNSCVTSCDPRVKLPALRVTFPRAE